MSALPKGVKSFWKDIYKEDTPMIIIRGRRSGMRSLLEAQRILAMAEQHCINAMPKIKGEVLNVRRS